jgi:hypothetical protein
VTVIFSREELFVQILLYGLPTAVIGDLFILSGYLSELFSKIYLSFYILGSKIN